MYTKIEKNCHRPLVEYQNSRMPRYADYPLIHYKTGPQPAKTKNTTEPEAEEKKNYKSSTESEDDKSRNLH